MNARALVLRMRGWQIFAPGWSFERRQADLQSVVWAGWFHSGRDRGDDELFPADDLSGLL